MEQKRKELDEMKRNRRSRIKKEVRAVEEYMKLREQKIREQELLEQNENYYSGLL